jgi:hypothetical protein
MITAEMFKQYGFSVTQFKDVNEIARAERDCVEAYIKPVLGENIDYTNETVLFALLNLTFLLLCRRSVKDTRTGGVTKQNQFSTQADFDRISQEQTRTCAMWLKRLKALDGANCRAEIIDIAYIYLTF